MIPHIANHKIYPKTFLHRVIFQLNYVADIKDRYIEFKKFFRDTYGLDLDESQYELLRISSMRISDNNNGIFIKFSKGFFQIRIEKQGYVSFEQSMKPFVVPFAKMLTGFGAKIERLSVKKINMWICEGEDESPSDAISHFLSDNLMDNFEVKLTEENEIRTTILRTGEDSDVKLMLSFGFLDKDKEGGEDFSRVILDSEGVLEKKSISAKDVAALTQNINTLLYDVFHWAVKPEVIGLMTKI